MGQRPEGNNINFGYSRPKSESDKIEQRSILEAAGCDSFYMERIGAKKISNKKFEELIDHLRPGDQLTVASIYVFPMTLLKLIELFAALHKEEILIRCVKEGINNKTDLYEILESFQRKSRSERSLANLPEGDQNPNVGRPKGMTKKTYQTSLAIATLRRQGRTRGEIKAELGINSNRVLDEALELHGLIKKRK